MPDLTLPCSGCPGPTPRTGGFRLPVSETALVWVSLPWVIRASVQLITRPLMRRHPVEWISFGRGLRGSGHRELLSQGCREVRTDSRALFATFVSASELNVDLLETKQPN